MAEGFYAMNRSIRNAKGDSAGPGKTTGKLRDFRVLQVTDEFLRTTTSSTAPAALLDNFAFGCIVFPLSRAIPPRRSEVRLSRPAGSDP
jgi:hypothetical protein